MLRLNSRANPTALVLSASAGSASRAAALTACAIVSLGDQHMPLQRVELSLISPVALYEGVASERLSAASDAVRRADVVVAVAPLPGAACGGLLPAFLDALPVNALKGKVVVPLLFG
ncbi:MAG: NAD(P)H-dependent oxidoreductase, partial [Planctomycetes bacterium]|nr:NAD(P)H-dependent oxidoreductase [Planctomycetota bacterium]